VALLNYDTEQDADGIWYLSHLASEGAAGRVSSSEDHRAIAPERYRMDVAVNGQSLKSSAQCALRFRTLREGVRMVRFELLPDMEGATVTFDGGSIPFVQEGRRHDAPFIFSSPRPWVGTTSTCWSSTIAAANISRTSVAACSGFSRCVRGVRASIP
jgi:hypothetical protein